MCSLQGSWSFCLYDESSGYILVATSARPSPATTLHWATCPATGTPWVHPGNGLGTRGFADVGAWQPGQSGCDMHALLSPSPASSCQSTVPLALSGAPGLGCPPHFCEVPVPCVPRPVLSATGDVSVTTGNLQGLLNQSTASKAPPAPPYFMKRCPYAPARVRCSAGDVSVTTGGLRDLLDQSTASEFPPAGFFIKTLSNPAGELSRYSAAQQYCAADAALC